MLCYKWSDPAGMRCIKRCHWVKPKVTNNSRDSLYWKSFCIPLTLKNRLDKMFSLALHCKALIGKLLLEICNLMSDVEIMTSHARKRTNIWSWYGLIIDLQMLVFWKQSAKYYIKLQYVMIFSEGQAHSTIIVNGVSSTAYHLTPAAAVNTGPTYSTSVLLT